jgi:chitinase
MRCVARRLALIGLAASATVLGFGATPAGAASCGLRSVSVLNTAADEGHPVGGGTLTFTVTTSGCAAGTVQYQAQAGAAGLQPATAGVDFVVKSGQLGWSAGEAGSKSVTVEIVGDWSVEPDEGVTVRLSMPDNLFIEDDIGRGTIKNDDFELDLLGPFCKHEDCVACSLRVETNAPVPADVTVGFTTGSGTALSGLDFVATSGAVTIPRGGTWAEIPLRILDDRVVEDDEWFTVTLVGTSAGRIRTGMAVVTIMDDDGSLRPT